MVKIIFQYRDDYSYPEWREQECICTSLKECKEIYGLGVDCEYKIISIEELD